jgi:hypothetical protein
MAPPIMWPAGIGVMLSPSPLPFSIIVWKVVAGNV